jgi:cytochrome c biogenesis factor
VSFYNLISLPLAAAMLLVLTGGSSFSWSESSGRLAEKRWWLIAIALGAMFSAIVFGIKSFFGILTVGLAAAAIVSTAVAIGKKTLSWPAGLTHTGVAVALTGIVFSSLATQSAVTSFEIEKRQEVLGMGITYQGKRTDAAGNGFYHQFKLDDPANTLLLPYTKQNSDGGMASHEPGFTAALWLTSTWRR